jgi:hypothetical protein
LDYIAIGLFYSGSSLDPYNTDSEGEIDELHPLAPRDKVPGTLRKPIKVDNLWNYVRDRKASKSNGFKVEYEVS